MTQATLNQNLIATVAGEQTVYNFAADTREYHLTSVEYLAIGVGIPANAAIDAPLAAKAGFAVCRKADLSGWEYVADHRGETVYDITSGKQKPLDKLGDYPADVTPLAPETTYDQWDGSKWVTDNAAQQAALISETAQKKAQLLTEAKNTISLWQTELQLGIISDDDKGRLIAWLQYIKLLQAVDPATAPDINWPQQPQ
ncbi:tail fiber assembly protein [Kosakonia pseudosacchari]|uniref:tail fiber assembly protein n=1 Tax=Kosakonia pseudosacchari TaxID=1646340 RepID=UPI000A3AC4C9|nr:tail fiber assembly protein [Kosakonia pseudosacchari]